MHPNGKLGVFIRAIAAGDTELRTSNYEGKKTHAYVTPVAANGHFGEIVQRVASETDLNDRRGNPIKRYKAGDIVEGEVEPRYDKDAGRVVERWTYTTIPARASTPAAVAK